MLDMNQNKLWNREVASSIWYKLKGKPVPDNYSDEEVVDNNACVIMLRSDNLVEIALEVKSSDKNISPHLIWLQEKYSFKTIQLVKSLRQEYKAGMIEVLKAEDYLSGLIL